MKRALLMVLLAGGCTGESEPAPTAPPPPDPPPDPAACALESEEPGVPVEIVGSNEVTLVRMSNGRAYCWGEDRFGLCGRGGGYVRTPTQLEHVRCAKALSAEGGLGAALTLDGQVLVWGSEEDECLGKGDDGNELIYDRAEVVPWLEGAKWVHAGANILIGERKEEGIVFAGELSLDQMYPEDSLSMRAPTPQQVATPEPMVAARGGGRTMCSLGESGSLYCWGSNEWGQLGDGWAGQVEPVINEPTPGYSEVPKRVPLSGRVLDFDVYGPTVVAVLEDGSAWAWGDVGWGALGVETGLNEIRTSPTRIQGLPPIHEVEATFAQLAFVAVDGSVWYLGETVFGVDNPPGPEPFPIADIHGVAQVALNRYTICILREDHTIACAGFERGQCEHKSSDWAEVDLNVVCPTDGGF